MSDKNKQKKGQQNREKDKNAKGNMKDQIKPQRSKKQPDSAPSKPTPAPSKPTPAPSKPTPAVEEKKPEEAPIDTVALFANLKRETDEILKITEGAKSKYAKREIRSNWTKYELPIDNYNIIEESSHGADFEELLQIPISRGGHFQFKHEKTWASEKKRNIDLFSLDLKYISSALACIPYYEKVRLNPSAFSTEQAERMKNISNKNMDKFKKNLPIEKEEKEIAKKILKKIVIDEKDSKNSETKIESQFSKDSEYNEEEDALHYEEELKENISEEKLIFMVGETPPMEIPSEKIVDTTLPVTTTETVIKPVKNEIEACVKKIGRVFLDDDDELDEILGLTNPKEELAKKFIEKDPVQDTIDAHEDTPSSTPSLANMPQTEVDLDKWLDEYLET